MLRPIAIVLVLSLSAATASAKGKPESAKPSKSHGSQEAKASKDASTHSGHSKGQNQHGHDGEPAGWDEGKKTGWGDCDAPPGQAKKTGGDCDKKKSGGILGVFKRDNGKKPEKNSKASPAKNSHTTSTRTTSSVNTATKPTATTPKTTAKTTTTTTTTVSRTQRTGTAPSGEDKLEAAKKR